MINAIIVDDEPRVIRGLQLLIKDYVSEVRVISACEDPAEAVFAINNLKPDLVFLDISMPGMDGFQLLEQLTFKHFHLVFITAYKEHALRALKLDAFDYLLKPVDIGDLENVVHRIRERGGAAPGDTLKALMEMIRHHNTRISLPGKITVDYVLPKEILYIEAKKKYAKVTLRNGSSMIVQKSLKLFDDELCGYDLGFMRVNHSFIANLNHVIRYLKGEKGSLIMEDGTPVPLSRQTRPDIQKFLDIGRL